jgi:hypothetical protein
MTRKALLLIYLFSTNSIAGMWYHDTANEAQFNIDSAQCQLEAQQVVQAPRQYVPPPQSYNQQVPPSYNTQCRMIGNTMYCDSNPSQSQNAYQEHQRLLQNRYNQQYELGRNVGDAIARNLQLKSYVETCLKARGYVWK